MQRIRLAKGAARLCVVLAGPAVLAHAGQAVAQDANEAGALAPLVVTTQKRAQDVLDVPMSLSVRSGEDLRDLGVQTLRDLAPLTPGLHIEAQDTSTPSIVVRGVSSEATDVTQEPRVSVFQDGVYISRSQAALTELFDVSRVEVAKGPQSTLFGRSALAGAINIIQNKADPRRLALFGRAEAGNLDAWTLDAMVNAPLGEGAALRLAAHRRERDGYVRNLAGGPALNGYGIDALRGALHLDRGDSFSADLIVNAQRDRSTGLSLKSGTFYPTDPATGARIGDLKAYTPVYLSTQPSYPLGPDMGSVRRLAGATLLMDIRLAPTLRLSSTSAFSRFSTRFVGDYDGTALAMVTAGEKDRGRQFSQDLRLAWSPAGRLSGFAGASIAVERDRQLEPFQIDEREALGLLTGFLDRRNPTLLPERAYTAPATLAAVLSNLGRAYGAPLPPALAAGIAANLQPGHLETYERLSRTRSADLYGELVFKATDRLELQGGLRFTADRKTSGLVSYTRERSILAGVLGALSLPEPGRSALLAALAAPNAASIPTSAAYPVPMFALLAQPTATTAGDRDRLDSSGLAWRLTARYALSPRANLYAAYARGRRPDVLSAEPPTAPGGPARFSPLAAETLDSYEAGLKLRTADGRLELEAAGFGYGYRHFQTEILVGTVPVQTDAGRASAHGFEAQGRWAPASWAQLFASYAYTHARFGSGLYEGNHFRLSPDHAASVGGRFSASLLGGEASLSPAYVWRSRLYFDNSNGDPSLFIGALLKPLTYQASQGDVGIANLTAAFAPRTGGWRLEASVANLFDRRYLRDTGAGSLQFGLPTYVAAPPRTWSFAVSFTH